MNFPFRPLPLGFSVALLFFALLTSLPCARGATTVNTTIFPAGTNGVRTSWNTIPGRSYILQSTTNLFAPWRDALPMPGTLTAATNFLSQTFATDALARFFRVLQVDSVGPEVYRVEPVAGGHRGGLASGVAGMVAR